MKKRKPPKKREKQPKNNKKDGTMFVFKEFIFKKARIFWLFGFCALFFLVFATTSFAVETKTLKESLRGQIEEIEKQINDYQTAINSKKNEAQTLSNEIKTMDTDIKRVELEIKKTDLSLKEMESEIESRTNQLSGIENFLSQRKILLEGTLRELQETDDYSLVEMILEKEHFSDFFSEVQSLQSTYNRLESIYEELRDSRKELETEKEAYEEARQDQLTLRSLQKLQEKELKDKIEGRKRLLQVTKGQEANYQTMLKSSKKTASEIKKQLFMLEGMAITFEEAFSYAKFSSEKTGVRAALLLAVLTIETKLGTDMGKGNWKVDMKAADREAFKNICSRLNVDPDLMPVSRKPSYGWGGAMGPGQFLPRTWLIYESKVAEIVGHSPANPWNLKDAFVATALKLASGGANSKTYEGERKAVLQFFAGSNWKNSAYSWYGEKVMNQAEVYQKQVDILEGK